jgi:hypothetical protein
VSKPNGSGGFDRFAGTNENGAFRSTDNGVTWIPVNAGLTNAAVEALAVIGTDIVAGGFSGVYLSTDNGASWSARSTGLPSATAMQTFGVQGSTLFVGSSAGVHRSTDNGTNWTVVNNGLGTAAAQVLAVSGSNLYAAGNGMYLSTNQGTSWTSIGAGIGSTSIKAVAFLGTDIFAGTQNGVFRSTNNGASWTAANGGLNSTSVSALTSFGTTLIAAAGFGLYSSSNSGTNWIPINTGLPNSFGIIYPTFNTLAAVPASGGSTVFAGSFLLGIWRRPVSQITGVLPGVSAIPEEFSLAQNYPNPFNPETVIRYQLSVASNVHLAVYDLLGREVSTLVSEREGPGSYEVKFSAKGGSASGGDGAGLSSGVYFYKLTANNLVQTRKLMLLR